MNQPLFAVYGCSGFGREVIPLARNLVRHMGHPDGRLVFVDDSSEAQQLNGHKVMRYEEFLATPASKHKAVLAIANSAVREKLARRLMSEGVQAWTVMAGNVEVMDDVQLGEGAILSSFVTLTSNIHIGRHFHANIYSYVAHDCVIGDFVTFAPAVKCNGNIVIEDHAYIGAGAVIKQGRPGEPLIIGRGAVVGMGAVVTKNVAPGMIVVGNPARSLRKG